MYVYVFGNLLFVVFGKSDKEFVKVVSVDLNFKGIDFGGILFKLGSFGDINVCGSLSVGVFKLMVVE